MGIGLKVSPTNVNKLFVIQLMELMLVKSILAIYDCYLGFQADIQAVTACEQGPGSLKGQNCGSTDSECLTV